MDFVDLNRRFKLRSDEHDDDPDLAAAIALYSRSTSLGWTDICRIPRAVVLAEAGSGKSTEMRAQAQRLADGGEPAFFLDLNTLARLPLVELLDPDEAQALETWRATGSVAYFFLDSVDEVKISDQKLEEAFRSVAKAIQGHSRRAHVVVSSRPSDWRSTTDAGLFKRLLPASAEPADRESRSPGADHDGPSEVVFWGILEQPHNVVAQGSKRAEAHLQTFVMLPMDREQIRSFASASGAGDVGGLLGAIERERAWLFAGRPLDLQTLLEIWRDQGRLGSLTEQYEASIKARLSNSHGQDGGLLSDLQAREGAERLALALTLMKHQTIRAPDEAVNDLRGSALDAAEILPDWTPRARASLLRRALFDPATHGRIRFHHRSVTEYLAAKHLQSLRKKNLSAGDLERILFADRYGKEVVIPSMEPTAAWLSAWDDQVFASTLRRSPDALFLAGDAVALSPTRRAQTLRALVERYGKGRRRGMHFDHLASRRFAHAGLGLVIRELWHAVENDDIKELLLELVWQGRLGDCADLALSVALSAAHDDQLRIIAVRAVAACGPVEMVNAIVSDLVFARGQWPSSVTIGIAAYLFPLALTVPQLLQLVVRTNEPKNRYPSFSTVLAAIARDLSLESPMANHLRDELTELLWAGRVEDSTFWHMRGKYDHCAVALATLCLRQLDAGAKLSSEALLRACVIAGRFGRDHVDTDGPLELLRGHLRATPERRRITFWSELELIDGVEMETSAVQRLARVERGGLVGALTAADEIWLITALRSKASPSRRAVALSALTRSWETAGRDDERLTQLRAAVTDDVQLLSQLAGAVSPVPLSATEQRWAREEARRLRRKANRSRRLRRGWQRWRDDILAAAATAFEPSRRRRNVYKIYSWLGGGRSYGYRIPWSQPSVAKAFGQDIALGAAQSLREMWRELPVVLRSARPPGERDDVQPQWMLALEGMTSESEAEGWTLGLDPSEAAHAASIALIASNGLPACLTDLATTHPEEVAGVLAAELKDERRVAGPHGHLETLERLSDADTLLKRLMAPHLLALLDVYGGDIAEESRPARAHQLRHILGILRVGLAPEDLGGLSKWCGDNYLRDPDGFLALTILRHLLRFDTASAVALLEDAVDGLSEGAARRATEALALIGAEQEVRTTGDVQERVDALGRLAAIALRFDSAVRDTRIASPETRKAAAKAKTLLLSELVNTPGAPAFRLALELADHPNAEGFAERLRFLAEIRASKDAEPAARSASDVRALEACGDIPAVDRDGLFTIVRDRMADIAHEIAHGEFTNRKTLQSITAESEMQLTLAQRLRASAKDAYLVQCESITADNKRTDLRVLSPHGGQQAVIELKLASHYSGYELLHALEAQLVGQYLRHEACRAGWLVVTDEGKQAEWRHPVSRKLVKLTALVGYLKQRALELEAESQHTFRVGVYLLDLKDPPLVPVHRS